MDEIKRLQAEFAAAQMSGSATKLSERNMVQVIVRLAHVLSFHVKQKASNDDISVVQLYI